ncbi:MAG: DUF455 family protein [Proteobacteria bacterium]|nr:DUF455 family protein [Pseudomonadota bacterium]
MTARAFAHAIVTCDTLAGKRVVPGEFELVDREPPLVLTTPGRPANLAITDGRGTRVPPLAGIRDPAQRARILHAFANHELQAIELFAWALLAFPDAPVGFRRGLLAILADEQRHLTLYLERLAAHGVAFGDHPVTGHFWNKLDHFATPIAFACAMGLTFENANLDFALETARAARAVGDGLTADVLERVHEDEIAHVHFGWVWMRRLAGETTDPYETYVANTKFPLGARRAIGATFDRASRERAGLTDAFIDALAAARRES